MELKVKEYNQPAQIEFNFEELKNELAEKVKFYETIVYTDDQIKQAKADRASLNKLKTALNDERIRREREYMQPFNEFKDKIGQIIAIIDRPVYLIDKQVKEYEKIQKGKKKADILELAKSMDFPEWLTVERIFNEKWLNNSVSLKTVQGDIETQLNGIKIDLATLAEMPEFSFESTEVYKSTLDINKAINEGKRLLDIQKRKEAQEKAMQLAEEITKKQSEEKKAADFMNPPVVEETSKAVEGSVEEVGQWINFSARLTVPQALELREFFKSRNIEFKAI